MNGDSVKVTVSATVNGGATPVSVTGLPVNKELPVRRFIDSVVKSIDNPAQFTVSAADNNTTILVAGTSGNTLTNIQVTIA